MHVNVSFLSLLQMDTKQGCIMFVLNSSVYLPPPHPWSVERS